MTINRPPTKDEIQYTRDLLQGKRKRDVHIIVGFTIFGALFGIAVAISYTLSSDEPFDPLFCLASIGACAVCLAICSALVLSAIRTLQAFYKSWLPARIIILVVIVLAALNLLQSSFFWMMAPSMIVPGLIMKILFWVFGILLLTIGLRIVFLIYCTFTGKQDEEILAKHIAAPSNDPNDRKNTNTHIH